MADVSVSDLVKVSKMGGEMKAANTGLDLLTSLDMDNPLISTVLKVVDKLSDTPEGKTAVIKIMGKLFNIPDIGVPLAQPAPVIQGIEPASDMHGRVFTFLNGLPPEKLRLIMEQAAEAEKREGGEP